MVNGRLSAHLRLRPCGVRVGFCPDVRFESQWIGCVAGTAAVRNQFPTKAWIGLGIGRMIVTGNAMRSLIPPGGGKHRRNHACKIEGPKMPSRYGHSGSMLLSQNKCPPFGTGTEFEQDNRS